MTSNSWNPDARMSTTAFPVTVMLRSQQHKYHPLFFLAIFSVFIFFLWAFLSDYPLRLLLPSCLTNDDGPEGYRYCYRESESTIIFIHLTNKTDQWLPLEVCAFKSAALLNRDSGLCVMTKYPMRQNRILSRIPNLEIAPLDEKRVFKNTPLERWYGSGVLNGSDKYYVCHLSDSLRYAYLYKYGGRYLDTDFISLRSFNGLDNVLGRIESWQVNGAVLFFPRKHPLITHLATRLPNVYKPGDWNCTGPQLITDTDKAGVVDKSTYSVMEPHAFYPIRYFEFTFPFLPEKVSTVKHRVRGSYAMHLFRQMFSWNKEFGWNHSVDITRLERGSFMYQFYHKVCLMDGSRAVRRRPNIGKE